MGIRGGHRLHVLRVDLAEGTIEHQLLLDENVLRKYVGGSGLGMYLLLNEASPQA